MVPSSQSYQVIEELQQNGYPRAAVIGEIIKEEKKEVLEEEIGEDEIPLIILQE